MGQPLNTLFRWLLVVGHLAAISAAASAAKAASANEVLSACKLYLSVVDRHGAVKPQELERLMDAGECVGFVTAILTLSQDGLIEPIRFCPPPSIQDKQGVRVVVAHIDSKPERGHEEFITLALEALRKAWPCP